MSSRTRGLAVVAGALALGLAAAPAQAATFTLSLSAPPAPVAGQPFAIQASGTDPTDQGALYLEIDAIPASVTTTCPGGYLDASQLATSTGGSLVAFDQRENLDPAGNFTNVAGYTPKAAGQVLMCGYTDDGATDTLAASSLLLSVQAAGAPPAPLAKPANTRRPRVTRRGHKLTCSTGAWANAPSAYAYRWLVNGRAKRGATHRTLTITRGLRGHRVQCSVRASNAAGAATAVSAPLRVR